MFAFALDGKKIGVLANMGNRNWISTIRNPPESEKEDVRGIPGY